MTSGDKIAEFVGTLEGKLFVLAIISFFAVFWAMSQNWKDPFIDSLKSIVLLIFGALAGAYGKSKGFGEAQTGPQISLSPPGPSTSSGATTNELSILSAEYGAGNHVMDVTQQLNNKITNNSISIQVSNAEMGGDPAYGFQKTLSITYSYMNQKNTTTVKEGDYLVIPLRTGLK
jgi:hypothetical protein